MNASFCSRFLFVPLSAGLLLAEAGQLTLRILLAPPGLLLGAGAGEGVDDHAVFVFEPEVKVRHAAVARRADDAQHVTRLDLLAHGDGAETELRQLSQELKEMEVALNGRFPLSDEAMLALFADLQSHLEQIYTA